MNTGVYHLELGPHPSMTLEFTNPVVKQLSELPTNRSLDRIEDVGPQHTAETVQQVWESDKIQDFVQRLGFYDAKEECHSGMIEKFYYINKVSPMHLSEVHVLLGRVF